MRLEEIVNNHLTALNETDMVVWRYIVQHRESAKVFVAARKYC